MNAGSARTLIPVLALIVFAGLVGWYFARQREPASLPTASPAADAPRAAAFPAEPPRASADAAAEPRRPAALPGADAARIPGAGPEAGGAPATPGRSDAAADPRLPSFDVVRVEPTGESVIAGRASPGATVELLRNGQSFARAVADASGLFAIVPPELPGGSHEIVLQATSPEGGARARSAQSVTVVVAADRRQKPLVAVAAPDQPTVVLSQPDAATATAAAPTAAGPPPGSPARVASAPSEPAAPAKRQDIRIGSVEAAGSGRLFVSGQAAPGATIRLYLNDAYVAPSGTGADGKLSFSIERGIRPGEYRVRLDDVDPVTGAVKSRAEVPFTVPAPSAVATAEPPLRTAIAAPPPAGEIPRPDRPQGGAPATTPVIGQPDRARAGERPGPETPVAAARGPAATEPGQVIVPEINTAIVARGDNLWRISRRVYGQGLRYTVIYGANSPQIRNPDLIYPGQVFVLPSDQARSP